MPTDIQMPHEKLIAYQVAVELLQHVQQLRIADPRLRDQVLRSSKSVCLNIAEAVGRLSDSDRKRVDAIARGECCEAAAAIDIARTSGECDPERGRSARDIAGRVYALRRSDSKVRFRDDPSENGRHARARSREIELENEDEDEDGY